MQGHPRKVYKHALINYPTIFCCPLDVSIHLFATIGNGYEWTEDGKLKSISDEKAVDNPLYQTKIEDRMDGSIKNEFTLQNQSGKLMYDFITSNIERVLDCRCDTNFFKNETRYSHYVSKSICCNETKALAFLFPNNIDSDWADCLLTFYRWWLLNLNQNYGVDIRPGKLHNKEWWPKDIQKAYDIINQQIETLFFIMYGKTQAEFYKGVL